MMRTALRILGTIRVGFSLPALGSGNQALPPVIFAQTRYAFLFLTRELQQRGAQG
jgi:hypothetical protein